MSCQLYKLTAVNGKIKVTDLCGNDKPKFYTSLNAFNNSGISYEQVQIPIFSDCEAYSDWLCNAFDPIEDKLALGISNYPMCRISDSTKVMVRECKLLDGTIEISVGGVTITQAQLDADYTVECTQTGKTYIEEIERRSLTDTKEIIPIAVYQDSATGQICYFLTTDLTLSNPLNINDFIMPNYAGMPPVAEEKTTGKVAFELCGELIGTFADVLAAALAVDGFVMPDGSAPDGLLGVQIAAEYKGQTCAGQTTTGQGATIGAVGSEIASIDGGQSWCSKFKYTDADCDGKAGNCFDLTTVINIPAGHGVIVEVVGVVCDTDDADATV